MKREEKRNRIDMILLFTVVVFLAGLINSIITTLAVYFLIYSGMLTVSSNMMLHVVPLMTLNTLLSIPVGLLVSLGFSKFPLKPIRDLIVSMDKLASGDFRTRISIGPIMRRIPAYANVAESFNKMAQELESTEMLRLDFINNFSHEFKTPIVSITGFAKLLKRGNLPQEQQREYLTAIEEESMRLSRMSTNVLNLTRVENQAILTNVSEYNLSEQIRSCMLLLESKWEKKDLELVLEFDEHMICANEEQMKQVWINLLDNAIKFAPAGHTVRVRILDPGEKLAVEVMNTGSEIPEEHQKKIFQKFYQADESHSTQGNGVGLAIVKRIVELHGGEVAVASGNEVTAFTVELPKAKNSKLIHGD